MRTYAKFDIDIYRATCHIFHSHSMEDAQKHVEEKLRVFIDGELDGAGGGFIFNPTASQLIMVLHPSGNLLGNVFHESCHLAFHLLDDRGIKHTMETDEAFAYLGTFIFEKTVAILKKNAII